MAEEKVRKASAFYLVSKCDPIMLLCNRAQALQAATSYPESNVYTISPVRKGAFRKQLREETLKGLTPEQRLGLGLSVTTKIRKPRKKKGSTLVIIEEPAYAEA